MILPINLKMPLPVPSSRMIESSTVTRPFLRAALTSYLTVGVCGRLLEVHVSGFIAATLTAR